MRIYTYHVGRWCDLVFLAKVIRIYIQIYIQVYTHTYIYMYIRNRNIHIQCGQAMWSCLPRKRLSSYVCHDSFKPVPWFISMRATTHSLMCNIYLQCWQTMSSFLPRTGNLDTCAMTLSNLCHDSFICVPRLIHLFATTQSLVSNIYTQCLQAMWSGLPRKRLSWLASPRNIPSPSVHTYMCLYLCMYTHVNIRLCISTPLLHRYIHTCICICVGTHIYANVHVYIHANIHTFFIGACACCRCKCMCARV